MSSQKIKFGDKEVNKKEIYSSKEAIIIVSKLKLFQNNCFELMEN